MPLALSFVLTAETKSFKEMSNLWNLKLHEELYISAELRVQRVPGGWTYTYYQQKEMMRPDGYTAFGEWQVVGVVFVPYTTELRGDVVEL